MYPSMRRAGRGPLGRERVAEGHARGVRVCVQPYKQWRSATGALLYYGTIALVARQVRG